MGVFNCPPAIEHIVKRALMLSVVLLRACVTTSPSSSVWSKIEGCWAEQSDHWPAFMTWRRDPEHVGSYLGDWRREAAQGDVDRVAFTLTPSGETMQLCESAPGGVAHCDTAVFGSAGWRQDGVAVFDVGRASHEFGYAGATAPFFWGRRASCH